MADEVQPPEVWTSKQPMDPRDCLTVLPIELHFRIINLALAAGQERDVSALAGTSKTMYFIVNHELYRLVVKHKTFFLLHWAAREGRLDLLKLALAHGANPNQMRTSTVSLGTNNNNFRPLGFDLQTRTDAAIDLCVWMKRREMMNTGSTNLSWASTNLSWRRVWFSCASLSTASRAQILLLLDHYRHVLNRHHPNGILQFSDDSKSRLVELPGPLDEDFSFLQNMSPLDMDRRDVKISFVRLFQFWDAPLHMAAAHDQVSVTEALLANGGDVDYTATEACRCFKDAMPASLTRPIHGNLVVSYTPLHIAICTGSYRVAKVLVASGADRMARIFRRNGTREWLVENALHRALSWRDDVGFDYDFIEFLLDQGYAARLEERNFEGATPLQIACQAVYEPAQMSVLRLLLRYGADPNSQCSFPPGFQHSRIPSLPGIRNNDRATIGLWATRQGNFQVAKLLLDHGGDAKARSSAMNETMLFAVCTARNERADPGDEPTQYYWRMKLLDALLARDTARDLNTFYLNDRNLLMSLIRAIIFVDLPSSYFGGWEPKVFMAGADIMAGANMGKVTPLKRMISDVLDYWFDRTTDTSVNQTLFVSDFFSKVLIILRASGINKHRYRPTAMLNWFWGKLKRKNWHIGIALYMLPALLGADFSPAEVDEHGDTAMTSFLQHLIENPRWAEDDSTFCHLPRGWILPAVMALLQEHDAALHKKNDKNLTAFDYLDQIVNYEGKKEELIILRRVMRRSVRAGLDDHRARCFKFHPMELVNRISGDDTILRLRDNQSRWLICEHLCRRGYCNGFGANWRCACTTNSTRPRATCEGDCCLSRNS